MALSNRNLKASLAIAVLIAMTFATLAYLCWQESTQILSRTKLIVGETDPMNESNEELPKDVLIWEIDFDKINPEDVEDIHMKKNIINVHYRRVAKHVLAQGNDIDDFLKEAAKGNLPQDLTWHEVEWTPRNGNPPRETPLSIRHNEHAHMIFLLKEMNWQFMGGHDPFRVQKDKGTRYTRPRCAWIKDGAPVAERQPDRGQCRVAGFVSNAKADMGVQREFVTQFNFYISIKITGKDGKERYLPLVIDPDVGYPGGNIPAPKKWVEQQ